MTQVYGGVSNLPPVPPGGTTGQVLTKNSNNDWDVSWGAGGGGGGTPGGSSGDIQYNSAGAFAGSNLKQGTNIVEERNGATAQSFQIYNSYTDVSNYSRLNISFLSGAPYLKMEAAGTGTADKSFVFESVNTGATNIAEFKSTGTTSPLLQITGTDRNVRIYPDGQGLAVVSGAYTAYGNGNNFAFRSYNGNGTTHYFDLCGDAADTMTQRNGTNAQTYQIYNTYTNSTNYERGFLKWSGNVFNVGCEAAGTGTVRTVNLVGAVTASSSIAATGAVTGSNLSGTNTGDQFTATTAGVLIGRTSASAGAAQEITLGTNLSMSGTTLNATGGGSGGFNYNPAAFGVTAATYKTFAGTTAGAGDVDVYTVPAGKRVFVSSIIHYNPTGGTITVYLESKISGTYQRLTNAVPVGTVSQNIFLNTYIYEAGEIVSFNATATGLIYTAVLIEYSNTEGPFSPKLTTLIVGDNTLYTPSTTTTAYTMDTSGRFINASGAIRLWNATGGTVTYIPKYKVSGGSALQFAPSSAVTTASSGLYSGVPNVMANGDAIVINSTSSTAGQFIWTTVVEKP